MLPQKFYFVTTFYQDLNWKMEKATFFLFFIKNIYKIYYYKKKA